MINPVLNPAGSFDFGTQCWAMSDDIDQSLAMGHYVVDEPTAKLGHDRIEAAYADYCKENYL